jgi:hypothetical protein
VTEDDLRKAAEELAKHWLGKRVMRLPKIEALDLRSLYVIVAEHNAKGGLQLAVWSPDYFYASLKATKWQTT